MIFFSLLKGIDMKKTLEEQMIYAAHHQDAEKVFELMALGARPFCKDAGKRTVPEIARMYNDIETFEVFWKGMRAFHEKFYRRVVAHSQPNRVSVRKSRQRTV